MSEPEQPIELRYLHKMNSIARTLDEIFNLKARGKDRKVGFALLVFPFGGPPDGRINYISNADRKDMLVAMKEFIARNDGLLHETETKQ